jgi:hypothetical protein
MAQSKKERPRITWLTLISYQYPRLKDWRAHGLGWFQEDIEPIEDRREYYSPFTRVVEISRHGKGDVCDFLNDHDYSKTPGTEKRDMHMLRVVPICHINSRRALYSIKDLTTSLPPRTRCHVCHKPLNERNYPHRAVSHFEYINHTSLYERYELTANKGGHNDCFVSVRVRELRLVLKKYYQRKEELKWLQIAQSQVRKIRKYLRTPNHELPSSPGN